MAGNATGDLLARRAHPCGPLVELRHGSFAQVPVAVDLQHSLANRSWPDSVREVEALGYSTMFVPDHFDEGVGPIAALATAAAITTTLNVGPLVLDCDRPATSLRSFSELTGT